MNIGNQVRQVLIAGFTQVNFITRPGKSALVAVPRLNVVSQFNNRRGFRQIGIFSPADFAWFAAGVMTFPNLLKCLNFLQFQQVRHFFGKQFE